MNRAVLGEFTPKKLVNGVRVPQPTVFNYYPRIISEKQWQDARNAIDKKNRFDKDQRKRCIAARTNERNLFAGIIEDISPDLEKPLNIWYERRNERQQYLMTNKFLAPLGKVHRISYAKFEAAFLRFVTELGWQQIISKGTPEELRVKMADLESVSNELSTLKSIINAKEARLDTLTDADQERIALESIARLTSKKNDLESRQQVLSGEVSAIRSKIANLENPQTLLNLIAQKDDPEIRGKLRAEILRKVSKIGLCFPTSKQFVLFAVKFVNGVIGIGVIAKDGTCKCLKLGTDLNLQSTGLFQVAA